MSTTRVVPFERKVSFKADAEASVRRHGDGVKRSQRSLRRNLTFQTSSLKYASSRELNRPQLAPQRHTLKRNSSELWSGLFRSDSASKEKIVHAKTLLALQRYSQSHRLNTLDLQKRRLLPLKIALCVCALPVLFVHLRLRGNAAETDEDDYGQQGRNGDTCDLLKTIELALTAALLLLQIRDDYLHRRILHIVLQRQWLDFYGMALVQARHPFLTRRNAQALTTTADVLSVCGSLCAASRALPRRVASWNRRQDPNRADARGEGRGLRRGVAPRRCVLHLAAVGAPGFRLAVDDHVPQPTGAYTSPAGQSLAVGTPRSAHNKVFGSLELLGRSRAQPCSHGSTPSAASKCIPSFGSSTFLREGRWASSA